MHRSYSFPSEAPGRDAFIREVMRRFGPATDRALEDVVRADHGLSFNSMDLVALICALTPLRKARFDHDMAHTSRRVVRAVFSMACTPRHAVRAVFSMACTRRHVVHAMTSWRARVAGSRTPDDLRHAPAAGRRTPSPAGRARHPGSRTP